MSREAVLGRVRAMLAADKSEAAVTPVSYPRAGALGVDGRLHLLEERLREYDARFFHCSEDGIAHQITGLLSDGGKRRMVHPAGVPLQWLDPHISWTADTGVLLYSDIEAFDGVLTGAAAAVAESGSIVLQHGPAEGRRALTLLPDYHICVLFKEQVVETLPECFDRLRPGAARPITFVSGPSATADIEMTRIKGVHGPRFLDVVLVS
ncbi:MAG: LUD domain-containing protein [Silvibacterium sp.]|nr:LUD domain-containing protein [Silvibacterium sp.]